MSKAIQVLLTLLLLSIVGAPASALTIDFEEFTHGQIIRTSQGVGIRTTNTGGGPDIGLAFDTNETGTRDVDLQFISPSIPTGENGWASGNIDLDTDLGNIMIIQENLAGCSRSFCLEPDDEGSRPAGFIEFDYSNVGPFRTFEMDVIDIVVSSRTPEPGSVDFFLGDVHLREVMFTEFVKPDVIYGNNSVNRLQFVKGLEFDRVIVSLNGSGGIDNVTTSAVPEPSAALLFVIGAVAMRCGVRKNA